MTGWLADYHPGGLVLIGLELAVVFLTANVFMRRAQVRARPSTLSGWLAGAGWVLGGGGWAAMFAGALIAPANWVATPDSALVMLALSVLVGAGMGAMALVAVRQHALAALLLAGGYVLGGVALLASFQLSAGVRINWPVVALSGLAAVGGTVTAFAGTLSARASAWRAGAQSALAGAVGLGLSGMLIGQSLMVADSPGRATPEFEMWLGTALLFVVMGQCALLLVFAWVEARLDARHGAAQAAMQEANGRLRQEAAQRAEITGALAESEERFRQAFDASPVGMSILGPQRQWLRVNAALCTFLGYTQHELLARTFEDVTHTEDIAATRAGLAALESGTVASFTQEKRYLCADGQVVHGLLHVSVAQRERGAPKEFVTQVLDITARRRAEDARAESEARFRSAFDDAAVAMALVGATEATFGRFQRVNAALCEVLGYTAEELLRTDNQHLILAEDLDKVTVSARQALEEGGFTIEIRYVHRAGRMVWVRLNVSLVRTPDGTPAYFVGQYENITAQKDAVEALERANAELARRIAEQERDGRAIELLGEFSQMLQSCQNVDEAQAVITRYGQRLLPETGAALYLMPASRNYLERVGGWEAPPGVADLLEVDDCWALRRGQMHAVSTAGTQLRCPHARHDTRASLCMPLVAQNETLGVLYVMAQGHAQVEAAAPRIAHGFGDRLALGLANLRLRESLRVQSLRDPLTGLYNRRFFEESLSRELARAARAQREVTLLMLDVDHFKRFNDTHGHDAGDVVLRAVAAELTARVRASDVLCRYGGEEFVALLPETDARSGATRAEALRAAVAALPITGIPGAGAVTISVGVATCPGHGTDPRSLLRAADQALYAAKGAGRNRVVQAASGEAA